MLFISRPDTQLPARRALTLAIVTALGALAASAAFAQEAQLGEVKVTSTTIDDRFTAKRFDPSSIHDISGKTVDEKRPQNMVQILNAIPGITADLSSGDEIKIKLRGVENQRYMGEKPGVAIVIDGVPVFERTGKVNVDLDNIESIRVIKGGASYLFGEDALSGAVIITTKRGARYAGVTVAADEGSWGYNRQQLRAGFATDWGTGHIQTTHRSSQDYYWQSAYKTDYIDGNFRLFLTDRSDLTVGFERSDRMKDKHGSVAGVNQAEVDPRGVLGRDYTRKYDVNLEKLNITYSNDYSDKGNVLVLAYQYKDRTYYWSAPQRYTSTGAAVTSQDAYQYGNAYDQTQRGVKGEWRTSAGELGWLAGLDLRANEYVNLVKAITSFRNSPASPTVPLGSVTSDDLTKENMAAMYGELKWAATNKLTITTNARYDHSTLDYRGSPLYNRATTVDKSKAFNVSSWRLGGTYAIEPQSDVFSNLSTGFRTPTAEQLYSGSVSPTGGTANNEDLKPEKSLTFEIGLRQRANLFGINTDIEAAVFQIERKDFILASSGQYSSSGSATVLASRYDNIGGARNRGFELSLKTDPKKTVWLDAAYSLIDARFTRYDNFLLALGNSNGTYNAACSMTGVGATNMANGTCYKTIAYNNSGNSLPRVPRHQLFTTFGWQAAADWVVRLEMDAKAWSWADEINQEKMPGRTLFNLHTTYDFKMPGTVSNSKWQVFARVDNLLDRKYFTIVRGTNDTRSNLTNAYNGVYDSNDPSMTVGKPRAWTLGLTASF
jgi:iron complex outermembrane receptor protein